MSTPLEMNKKIGMTDFFQMSPLFITTFMIMTSI